MKYLILLMAFSACAQNTSSSSTVIEQPIVEEEPILCAFHRVKYQDRILELEEQVAELKILIRLKDEK